MSAFSKLGDIIARSITIAPGGTPLQSSQIDPALTQRVKVTLTAAQIKALNTTPITLVAAQGAGTYVSVDEIVATLNYGTTQFTGSNNIEIRHTNGSGAKVTGDLAYAWLNGSAVAAVKAVSAALTPVANSAIVASVPTANPAAGDSTVTLDVVYRVVTLP